MKTYEFTERSGEDGMVRVNVPVDAVGRPYHVVVHVEPVARTENAEYLPDEFINDTAGKWIGEFTIGPEGEYEKRESL